MQHLAVLLLGIIAWLVWRTPNERQPQIAEVPTPAAQPSPSLEPVTPQPQPVTVVAQLNDGGRVLTLDQEGKLSGADDLPAAYKNLVTKALSTQRIEKSSQLQGLTRPPSSLMSSDNQKDQFSVLQPAGDVLLTDNPTFRWTTLEGATGYVVEVYDDKFNPVSYEPSTEQLFVDHNPPARQRLFVAGESNQRRAGDHITSPTRTAGKVPRTRSSQSKRTRAGQANLRLIPSDPRTSLRRSRFIKRSRTGTTSAPQDKPKLRAR